jgi:predicted GTPase
VFLDTTSDVTEQYMADVRTHVRENGFSDIKEFLKEKLERSKDVEIRFAIVGDGETEKSAFINAIRG